MDAAHTITTDTTPGTRTNRRRQRPARALVASLGRLLASPPSPERGREVMPTAAFAASRLRLAIA